MLQAYGEFDRFMQLSKHHMKQARRAQKLKDREQREFHQLTAAIGASSANPAPQEGVLYHDDQTTIKSRYKNRKSVPKSLSKGSRQVLLTEYNQT